jgi:hypothetical protein
LNVVASQDGSYTSRPGKVIFLDWKVEDPTLSVITARRIGMSAFPHSSNKKALLIREQTQLELDIICTTAPIGLYLHGTDIRILHINQRLAERGFSIEEHIGKKPAIWYRIADGVEESS